MKEMKITNDNGLSDLWTAEKANERALFDMWHDTPSIWDIEDIQDVADDEDDDDTETIKYFECVVPDVETAKAYIEAHRIREYYYGGTPHLLDREYTLEEIRKYDKIVDKIRKTHPDMRDQIIIGADGKKGLRDVCGNILIKPQFDDIPELYTCFNRTNIVPVVLDDRYYLYDLAKSKTVTKDYDRIFRYFGAYYDYFVAVENGKKGILDAFFGTESTPIDLDEVYEMPDPDGAIPVEKDGKVGFLWGNIYTQPIFDRVIIRVESLTRVLLDGKWGWIDSSGKFTQNESKASFAYWYDYGK
jgi:hypothetical protein